MQTYVALLRGINVGGSHMLPMKDLKLLFEKNGCLDVQTYLQSGNVILATQKRSPTPICSLWDTHEHLLSRMEAVCIGTWARV